MVLLFWICTVLLALTAIGGLRYERAYNAAWVLVAIDLVIIGLKLFGSP